MRRRHLLVGFVLTLWTVVVLSAYYVVHRPWPPQGPLNAILALIDLLVAFGLASLAGGIGQRLSGRAIFESPLEQAAVQLGVGVGFIGLSILGIGWLGLLRDWLIWLLFLAGLLILRREIRAWVGHFKEVKRQFIRVGTFGKILAFAFWGIVLLSLFLALAPPLKWDSLVYHLELPKKYIKEGGILYLADNQFVGWPQLVEMNFTGAMSLRSGTTAATYGWIVGVVGLLGVGGFAGRRLSSKSTFLAPMILLTGESLAEGLSWAYVDVWVFLFGLMMIISLEYFQRTGLGKYLIIGAVSAGFAASVKYTGGLLLILGVALLIYNAVREGRGNRWKPSPLTSKMSRIHSPNRIGLILPEILRRVSIFSLVALVLVSPWLLKNLAFTGNPVYPFFFKGGAMDPTRQDFYLGSVPERSLVDDLTLPWDATIFGVEAAPGYSTSIGPLMLVAIPSLFLTRALKSERKRTKLSSLIFIALLSWIFWALGSHISHFLYSSRLYYGFFPALAVLACAGFEGLVDVKIPRIRIWFIIQVLVILSVALALISMVYQVVERNPLPVIAGIQSRDRYLFLQLGGYFSIINEINKLPSDAKVSFLWESRAYYCEVNCSPDVVIDRWWYLSRSVGDSEGIADTLSAEGVTHVLISDTGIEFVQSRENVFKEEDWKLLNEFIEEELTEVVRIGEAYSLYSLNTGK